VRGSPKKETPIGSKKKCTTGSLKGTHKFRFQILKTLYLKMEIYLITN
jgi:hypothetical protein